VEVQPSHPFVYNGFYVRLMPVTLHLKVPHAACGAVFQERHLPSIEGFTEVVTNVAVNTNLLDFFTNQSIYTAPRAEM
jgi:hypothetical protein